MPSSHILRLVIAGGGTIDVAGDVEYLKDLAGRIFESWKKSEGGLALLDDNQKPYFFIDLKYLGGYSINPYSPDFHKRMVEILEKQIGEGESWRGENE